MFDNCSHTRQPLLSSKTLFVSRRLYTQLGILTLDFKTCDRVICEEKMGEEISRAGCALLMLTLNSPAAFAARSLFKVPAGPHLVPSKAV